MRRSLLLACAAFLLGAPALAQEPEWRAARDYDVLLAPWSYAPRTIHLEAGRPVRLSLVNNSEVGQHFAARSFFEAARIREADADLIRGGNIHVPAGERRLVALVPAPGRYRVRSANLLHRLLGMSAVIVVE